MYEPTDEQSEALWEATGVVDQPHARRFTDAELGEHLAASPAFQAIIRAAQAEAWDDGYDHGFYDREALSPDITGRDASEGRSINPYERSADD